MSEQDGFVDGASMLVVDDDKVFCQVLASALRARGFEVTMAHDLEVATRLAGQNPPEYVVLDLNLEGASGLTLIPVLKELDAETRIVVLTGYSSIATAVEAVKLGATHYLTKPAGVEEILAAFSRDEGDAQVPLVSRPPSVNRLEWEHLQKVLLQHQGNISAAARSLGMHRRTLQRKLQKRPARE